MLKTKEKKKKSQSQDSIAKKSMKKAGSAKTGLAKDKKESKPTPEFKEAKRRTSKTSKQSKADPSKNEKVISEMTFSEVDKIVKKEKKLKTAADSNKSKTGKPCSGTKKTAGGLAKTPK